MSSRNAKTKTSKEISRTRRCCKKNLALQVKQNYTFQSSSLCVTLLGHFHHTRYLRGSDWVRARLFVHSRNAGDMLTLFQFRYACSFGPLTWLITSEVFCPSLRGRALGFATVVTYLAAGLVSRTFLSFKESIGLSATLSLYWLATLLSLCFSRFGIPETVEKSPEEIETRVSTSVYDFVGVRSLSPLTYQLRCVRCGCTVEGGEQIFARETLSTARKMKADTRHLKRSRFKRYRRLNVVCR